MALGFKAPAHASVCLAGAVPDKLTSYEFVQWLATGQRILDPCIVDDHAVWVDTTTNAVIAPIG